MTHIPRERDGLSQSGMRHVSIRGGKHICLSCGCLQPANQHGDPRHITERRLQQAADAVGRSLDATAQQIVDTLEKPADGDTTDAAAAFSRTAKRPTLSFDVDDLIAHKDEALIDILNWQDGGSRLYADQWDVDAKKVWPELAKVTKQFRKTPAMFMNLVPYPDAVAFAQMCARAGYSIMIATKRKPKTEGVTMEWLKRVEFPQPAKTFFGKTSKIDVSKIHNADHPLYHWDNDVRNRRAMQQFPWVKVFIPKRPYTKNVPGTFDSWSEMLEMLDMPVHLFNLTQEEAY